MAFDVGTGSGHRSASRWVRTVAHGQRSWGMPWMHWRPASSDQDDRRLSDSDRLMKAFWKKVSLTRVTFFKLSSVPKRKYDKYQKVCWYKVNALLLCRKVLVGVTFVLRHESTMIDTHQETMMPAEHKSNRVHKDELYNDTYSIAGLPLDSIKIMPLLCDIKDVPAAGIRQWSNTIFHMQMMMIFIKVSLRALINCMQFKNGSLVDTRTNFYFGALVAASSTETCWSKSQTHKF